jgi:glutathione peroxidase
MDNNTIYQFDVQKLNGDWTSLSKYTGKVLLIVNTASQCSFTPQMADLEKLKAEINTNDFEILLFPSNDFGGQEPLEGDALQSFCSAYGSNCITFDKLRVRGPYAAPLYKFLSDKKQNGVLSSSPRWNFHKYLIGRDGRVADYFYPFTKPTTSKVKKSIQRLLAAGF